MEVAIAEKQKAEERAEEERAEEEEKFEKENDEDFVKGKKLFNKNAKEVCCKNFK